MTYKQYDKDKSEEYKKGGSMKHDKRRELHYGERHRDVDGEKTAADSRRRNDMKRAKAAPEDTPAGYVIGRNAVRELLRSGRAADKVFVARSAHEGSIGGIISYARKLGVPVIEVDDTRLDTMSCGAVHQGVIAFAAEKEYSSLDDVFKIAEERGEVPLLVIADDITDSGNLGAIIRSAECCGAHGVIIPKRHSVGISPVVAKASAGAVSHMAIVKETNLSATVEELKKRGVWVFAADADGVPYEECDFTSPTAIILGNEGDGVSRLLIERSDVVVSIPMYGEVDSLNVSCAAAVLLAEAARQMRRGKRCAGGAEK